MNSIAPSSQADFYTTLALAAIFELRHPDVKTAFLNGPLNEELYMRKPEVLGNGYWCIRKGIYRLKQAGRQWCIGLNATLE